MKILTLLAAILVVSGPLAFGQIASYSFDDGTASDVTGNGHDGALFGDPSVVEGFVGLGFSFDGIDDHIKIPPSPNLDTETVWLSFWFMLDEPVIGNDHVLISKTSPSAGYKVFIDASSGEVAFFLYDAVGGEAMVTSPFPAYVDTWIHVLAEYDGLDARLYLHGSLVASVEAEGIVM